MSVATTSRNQSVEAAKAAEKARIAAAQQAEAAKRLSQEFAEKFEQLTREKQQAEEAALHAEAAAEQAARNAKRALADVEPELVTLEVARECGAQLAAAVDAAYSRSDDERPLRKRIEAMWNAVDTVRDRFLTQAVGDAAQLTVLAAEGVIHGCARWEQARIKPTAEGQGHTFGYSPADSRHVQIFAAELKAVLSGSEQPEYPTVRIGQELAAGVAPGQIAKMVTLVGPNGEGSVEALGEVIDGAMAAGGYAPVWRFLVWEGCFSVAAAWQLRQQRIPAIRSFSTANVHRSPHGAIRRGRNIPGGI